MRRGLVALFLLLPATAQDDFIANEVASILTKFRAKVRGKQPERLEGATWEKWQREYEKLRAEAAGKVWLLIDEYGPRGSKRDVSAALEAMLSRPLAPPGKAAWEVTGRVLKMAPRSKQCWRYLNLLHKHVLFDHPDPAPPWSQLKEWARKLRRDAAVREQAARALDLFLGLVQYELGDRRGAKRAAEMTLLDEKAPDELKRYARRLRSRAALVRAGREAPGFRLPALDGKRDLVSRDFRGRALLLHFWHLEHDDQDLMRIAAAARKMLRKSELALLSVPLADDKETLAMLEAEAAAIPWPVAAHGEVARQVAAAYGVEDISALFLVSPDGKVLASENWISPRALDRIAELVQQSMGPPLEKTLMEMERTPGWAAFRKLWHGLTARNRTRFEDETWMLAKRTGPRALFALLLANATGERRRTPPSLPGGSDIHSRLVRAWYGGKWAGAAGPLAKPGSDESLALVDAVFDLGLVGNEVRLALENLAGRCQRWQTVSMALRALGFQDTTDPPRPLRKHGSHKRWQVRLALAEALRAYRHKEAVDALIKMVGDRRLRVRGRAARSLQLLTGQSLGTTQKRWKEWRRRQGANLRLLPREINRTNPFQKKGRKYAHRGYYGVQIASDHLVFVLDKSESMYYGLFDGVVEEMQAMLSSVGPTTRFGLIEFDEQPRLWQKRLVPANRPTVKKAVAWLKRARPYGPTNVIDSLRLALSTGDLDAMVLLSDGLPNRGDPGQPNGILEAVAKDNRYRRTAIHTVLLLRGRRFPHGAPHDKVPPLDEKEKLRRKGMRDFAPQMPLGRFLKQLAESNDGTFGVGFADSWAPPPGTGTRPSTDK